MTVPDYIDADDIKDSIPDTFAVSTTTKYDALLGRLATVASRVADRYTRRPAGAYKVTTATTRYFHGSGTSILLIDELAEPPSVVQVAETARVDTQDTSTDGSYIVWASSDYFCEPHNFAATFHPITKLRINRITGAKIVWYSWPRAVKITGKWGYSLTPPEELIDACIAYAVHEFERYQNLFGDTSAIIELGRLKFSKSMPPEAEEYFRSISRVTV